MIACRYMTLQSADADRRTDRGKGWNIDVDILITWEFMWCTYQVSTRLKKDDRGKGWNIDVQSCQNEIE